MRIPFSMTPRSSRKPARLSSATVLALSLLTGGGCGSGSQYAEVEGTITLAGKPCPNLEVAFLPDPEQGTRGPSSYAYTDEEGRYRLATKQGQAGALIGTHRVCIRDLTIKPAPRGPRPGPTAPGKPPARQATKDVTPLRFPHVYADSTQTPLRPIEVKPGTQTLNFDLPSTAPR